MASNGESRASLITVKFPCQSTMVVTIQEVPDSTETFVAKLLEVPLLKSAVTVVVSVYGNVKGHNTICKAGFTITEEILQKVCVVLEPLRKHFDSSMNSKLCDWLETIEQEHPQVMIPADQLICQSREYCSYLATTTVDTVCGLPATRICFDAADWLLARLYLVYRFQTKKILLARRGIKKIRRTQDSKALKDFASPRKIVSPRKRVTLTTKLYHWLNGLDITLSLEKGVNSDKSMQTDRDPEYKKRKRCELRSDSDDLSISDISDVVEGYISEEDPDYKPEDDEGCSTDSMEYKEDSLVEDINLEDEPTVSIEDASVIEDENKDRTSVLVPEVDRSNSFTIVAEEEREASSEEF